MSLEVNLESPLPAELPAGTVTAVYCSGTAWCDGAPVEHLRLLVDGEAHRPTAYAMPRFDMPVRRSGFWGVVPVRAPGDRTRLEIGAEVVVGGSSVRVPLGTIPVGAEWPPGPKPAASPGGKIAICMGTFDPDPDLFGAQLDSIRRQTDTDWTCVISDDHSRPERYERLLGLVGEDPRFTVSRAEERIGFYRNFERALELAPPDAPLIALADQDDVWRAEKLAVLRAALGRHTLVYSDMRLVDRHGRVLRDTLWQGRANNRESLGSLLIANTVTGASALFHRELLEAALPFPDSPGIEFHDHWIALVALCAGEIAYVERPLYDYVQHPSAILGKVTDPRERDRPRRSLLRRPRVRAWRAAYFLGYVPGEIRARTLLARFGDRLPAGKRRALERYLASGSSVGGFVRFVLRPARMLLGHTETLGGEWELAVGIIWRHLAALVALVPGWPDRFTLDTRFPDPPHFEQKRLRRWRERI